MRSNPSPRAAIVAAALLLSSGIGFAQAGTPAGQDKPAKAPEAAAAKPAQAESVRLSIPVTGLTKENSTKVESALSSLQREFFVCAAGCKGEHAQKGKCCDTEMKAEKKPILEEAKAVVDGGSVGLKTTPGSEIALSQVERALKSASVQLDEAKFNLAGKTTLVFSGPASQEEAVALGKALADAGVFQATRAKFDAASKSTRIDVTAGATPATRASVAAALEKAGSKAKLGDVVWGSSAAPART
jgi:hypothetical protein